MGERHRALTAGRGFAPPGPAPRGAAASVCRVGGSDSSSAGRVVFVDSVCLQKQGSVPRVSPCVHSARPRPGDRLSPGAVSVQPAGRARCRELARPAAARHAHGVEGSGCPPAHGEFLTPFCPSFLLPSLPASLPPSPSASCSVNLPGARIFRLHHCIDVAHAWTAGVGVPVALCHRHNTHEAGRLLGKPERQDPQGGGEGQDGITAVRCGVRIP